MAFSDLILLPFMMSWAHFILNLSHLPLQSWAHAWFPSHAASACSYWLNPPIPGHQPWISGNHADTLALKGWNYPVQGVPHRHSTRIGYLTLWPHKGFKKWIKCLFRATTRVHSFQIPSLKYQHRNLTNMKNVFPAHHWGHQQTSVRESAEVEEKLWARTH